MVRYPAAIGGPISPMTNSFILEKTFSRSVRIKTKTSHEIANETMYNIFHERSIKTNLRPLYVYM